LEGEKGGDGMYLSGFRLADNVALEKGSVVFVGEMQPLVSGGRTISAPVVTVISYRGR